MTSNMSNLKIAVVGGGFAGIAAGVYLTRAGVRNFTIFESSSGPGGTWWDNRYPGAEVDTPSHLYSYSFRTNDWTRPYAKHDELRAYLHSTVEEYGLLSHFCLETEVHRAAWDEGRHQYLVTTSTEEDQYFDAVISAVGMLNEPNIPTFPGQEAFTGRIMHTSRWDDTIDIAGKSISIIGTGSTSAQVIPECATVAAKVTVFQRQPSWVNPKPNQTYSSRQRKLLGHPFIHRIERLRRYYQSERVWFSGRAIRPGSKVDQRMTTESRAYMNDVLGDDPELMKAMIPDFPHQGKRPVKSSDFLPALRLPNVSLVPEAAVSFTKHGVISTGGTEHRADIVVLATGFKPQNYLPRLEVIGRSGLTLQEVWDGEAKAFLGATVPGFPNFFMMYGPNTNFYALVYGFEQQAKYAVRSLSRMTRKNATAIETSPAFFAAYNEWLASRLEKSSWAVGKNYFKSSKTGRVVTQWPDGVVVYGLLTKALLAPSSRLRRRKPDTPTILVHAADRTGVGATPSGRIRSEPATTAPMVTPPKTPVANSN
ncbi:flavin-containing monooxygenase [Paenarthrobacter sp. NPDC056912]|uniref:flavin-containing monooxygenase n=1 Tax=Paenarthrobacter sp. NPDC056912 TaxID=3345965 RepID=UPI00366D9EEA